MHLHSWLSLPYLYFIPLPSFFLFLLLFLLSSFPHVPYHSFNSLHLHSFLSTFLNCTSLFPRPPLSFTVCIALSLPNPSFPQILHIHIHYCFNHSYQPSLTYRPLTFSYIFLFIHSIFFLLSLTHHSRKTDTLSL